MSEKNDKKTLNPNAERHLIFSLGAEEYGVPILKVKEVIEFPGVTPIPHTPKHYLGIMNLRGQIISIIDLNLRIKDVPLEITKKVAVIILDMGAFCCGVAVSSVNRVVPISHEDIQDNPAQDGSEDIEYIKGVVNRDKRLILILDIAKALKNDMKYVMKPSDHEIKSA